MYFFSFNFSELYERTMVHSLSSDNPTYNLALKYIVIYICSILSVKYYTLYLLQVNITFG